MTVNASSGRQRRSTGAVTRRRRSANGSSISPPMAVRAKTSVPGEKSRTATRISRYGIAPDHAHRREQRPAPPRHRTPSPRSPRRHVPATCRDASRFPARYGIVSACSDIALTWQQAAVAHAPRSPRVVGRADAARRRPRLRALAPFAREATIIAGLYALWQLRRHAVGPRHVGGAFARADWIERTERALHLPAEARRPARADRQRRRSPRRRTSTTRRMHFGASVRVPALAVLPAPRPTTARCAACSP